MNRAQFTEPGTGLIYERISKWSARKCYETASYPFVVTPCNFAPFGPWDVSARFEPDKESFDEVTFDAFVNEFEFYNCNDAETGTYAAFYMRMEFIAP